MSPTTGTRQLTEELAALRSRLLEMSSRTEDLLQTALEAIDERSVDKARAVVEGDAEIDAMELALDDACINLLALHQPVARDLRFVAMAMRISNDIERIGDHAVNLGQAVFHLVEQPSIGRFRELEEMGRVARQMLTAALDALIRGDAAAARAVRERDDQVDALLDSLFRVLLTHMMEDPRRIGPAMSLILAGRNLERVADLATNIAEDVVYLVEGRTIKHGGA